MLPFAHFTIEPSDNGVAVFGHGVYERGSVLEGQPRRTFIDRFDTAEEALAEYPRAEEKACSTKVTALGDSLADASGLSQTSPPWFDPTAAGERWDDDY